MAVEFAPFHGEEHIVLTGIAIDGLHFCAEGCVQ
jgi:hypothetical protein